MDKSQFHIPNFSNEPEPTGALFVEPDAQQYTPETQPAAYKVLKDIEAKIWDYRETALQTGEVNIDTNRPWLRAIGAFKPKRVTIDALIEAESRQGGSLFGPGHQLWLHKKSDHPMDYGKSDWYHRAPAQSTTTQSVVLHYQVTETSIHKLYAGHERMFTEGEAERLHEAIIQYEKAIRPLYPIDGSLADLSDEDSSELPQAA